MVAERVQQWTGGGDVVEVWYGRWLVLEERRWYRPGTSNCLPDSSPGPPPSHPSFPACRFGGISSVRVLIDEQTGKCNGALCCRPGWRVLPPLAALCLCRPAQDPSFLPPPSQPACLPSLLNPVLRHLPNHHPQALAL